MDKFTLMKKSSGLFYVYRRENRDHVLRVRRVYYKNNPPNEEQKRKQSVRAKTHYQKNRSKRLTRQRELRKSK